MRTYRQILSTFGHQFPVMPEGLEMKLFESPGGYMAEVSRAGEETPFWSTECSRIGRVLFKVRQRFAPQELVQATFEEG